MTMTALYGFLLTSRPDARHFTGVTSSRQKETRISSMFSQPETLPSAPIQSILSTDTTVLPLPETLNGTL